MKLSPELEEKILASKPTIRNANPAFFQQPTKPEKAPKPSKWGNKRIWLNGRCFASELEGARYLFLLEELRAGRISGLRLQCPFPVVIRGRKCWTWVCDFLYFRDGRRVVEDVKGGVYTDIYRTKKPIVEAWFGFRIQEVTRKNWIEHRTWVVIAKSKAEKPSPKGKAKK